MSKVYDITFAIMGALIIIYMLTTDIFFGLVMAFSLFAADAIIILFNDIKNNTSEFGIIKIPYAFFVLYILVILLSGVDKSPLIFWV